MPAPTKVMMIPALAPPLVRAWMGVNVNEAVVTADLTAEASVIWRPLIPEISTNVPVVVVSSTVFPDIVAAATLFDGFCATLGLMMFVQTNDAGAGLSVPVEAELKMTVNTSDVRVAVAK